MNLRTFSAPTFAQAMSLVKSEMGGDAVILHTRTVQKRKWMGLRRNEIVEITAGNGLTVPSRPVRRPAAGGAQATKLRAAGARDIAGQRPTGPARPVAQSPQSSSQPGKDLLDTPAAGRAMMMSISSEVRELRGVLEDLVRRSKRETAPQVP